MEKKKKQLYQVPELTVVAFQAEQGYSVSSVDGSGTFGLHAPFRNSEVDAWGGAAGSSGNSFGGWTDNGESAWD